MLVINASRVWVKSYIIHSHKPKFLSSSSTAMSGVMINEAYPGEHGIGIQRRSPYEHFKLLRLSKSFLLK